MNETSNRIEKEVGLVGFVCPKDGGRYTFDFCFKKCHEQCYDLPILLALAKSRKVVPNVYSTTEILNPPKVVYLQQHNAYFSKPDSLIWATFGTSWHLMLEQQKAKIKELGLEADYIFENNGKPFGVTINTPAGAATLRGTPDLFHIPSKTLTDYKTMKYYYKVQYLLEKQNWNEGTEIWQINIYRVYCFPMTKEMKMVALIKDWNQRLKVKGIPAIVKFDVPFIRDEVIKETVKAKIQYLLECEKDPTIIRDCTHEEKWITKKPPHLPLRCLDYCPVNEFCEWFQKWSNKEVVPEGEMPF